MLGATFEDILKQLGCTCGRKHIQIKTVFVNYCLNCGRKANLNNLISRSKCTMLHFKIAGEDYWPCFLKLKCSCNKEIFARAEMRLTCDGCGVEARVGLNVFRRTGSNGEVPHRMCGTYSGPSETCWIGMEDV
jgi:hypothetical protein